MSRLKVNDEVAAGEGHVDGQRRLLVEAPAPRGISEPRPSQVHGRDHHDGVRLRSLEALLSW